MHGTAGNVDRSYFWSNKLSIFFYPHHLLRKILICWYKNVYLRRTSQYLLKCTKTLLIFNHPYHSMFGIILFYLTLG
jgi:hypothetical protein